MRTHTARAARTAAVAVLGLVALTGCSAVQDAMGGAQEPTRDEETGEITEAAEADVFAIAVGDCLNTADLAGDVSEVPTVPCSDPHESEVFAATDMPEGEFPGEEAVGTAADEFCLAEFASFVGMDYYDSALEMTTLSPTQETWDGMDDREILCVVEDLAGGVTGTLKGAQR